MKIHASNIDTAKMVSLSKSLADRQGQYKTKSEWQELCTNCVMNTASLLYVYIALCTIWDCLTSLDDIFTRNQKLRKREKPDETKTS